jgi:hypothetical protein
MQTKQQTTETLRQNIDTWHQVFSVSDEQAETNRKAYQAEKTKKYKIKLINGWRARGEA